MLQLFLGINQQTFFIMTQEQMLLVKNSWKIFRNVEASIIADLFYTKLFFDNPRLRRMFSKDMDLQYKKLVDMLTSIISSLDKADQIDEELKALAIRHIGYGVKRRHYGLVGDALIWTLEKGLGDDWNDKLKESWLACYKMIAEIMINATENQNV
jgi:hemoglobin-like flavoprotein